MKKVKKVNGNCFFVLSLLLTVLLATACSKDDSSDNPGENIPLTDWTPISGDQYPMGLSSMMITINTADFPATADVNDKLAAFVTAVCSDTTTTLCRATANFEGEWAMINVPSLISDENATSVSIELRYYSAQNRRIYTAESFDYRADSWLGSVVTGGFKPNWK